MSGFDADWLALREPFDTAARSRSASLLDWAGLADRISSSAAAGRAPLVLDLACGTGANLRFIAPRLRGDQRWRMIDHDPELLAALPTAMARWAGAIGWSMRREAGSDMLWLEGPAQRIEVRCQPHDLVAQFDALPFDEAALVTASALLDLVSAKWLDALLTRCAAHCVVMLWAMNVERPMSWTPPDRDDARVLALFAAHQQRDKGFGPSLGEAAAKALQEQLLTLGQHVSCAASDWHIDAGANHRAMARAMVDGMGGAALEQQPTSAVWIKAWQARRALRPGATAILGHADCMAWPAD